MISIREATVSNMWPQTQLEHYHPSDQYVGSQERSITPLLSTMAVVAAFESTEEVTLAQFAETVYLPMEAWVADIGLAVVQLYGGEKDGEFINRDGSLYYTSYLMQTASAALRKAHPLKAQAMVDRPATCKHPEYVDTYDTPCAFSYVMCQVLYAANKWFGGGNEELVYDTAYLLGMLPAMAGLNSPEACVHALEISNLTKKH